MQHKKSAHINEDNHHLLYPRKAWSKGYRYALRTHRYCSVLIDKKNLHRNIHAKITHIPIPSECNAQCAFEQLDMLWKHGALHDEDSIEKRLALLIALFDCMEQPTADALRKQLEIVRSFYKKPP